MHRILGNGVLHWMAGSAHRTDGQAGGRTGPWGLYIKALAGVGGNYRVSRFCLLRLHFGVVNITPNNPTIAVLIIARSCKERGLDRYTADP